eukprot:TRINITY_DN51281_c0_g1_i1.p2 TRINITY_DN51281_c0_g1~~TRINITY_DN51281_c0_g1_i1.p2  ORF type:complete len:211 (-),score=28.74 TRINITY_DN51281_c0_g1_i1:104-688(-)
MSDSEGLSLANLLYDVKVYEEGEEESDKVVDEETDSEADGDVSPGRRGPCAVEEDSLPVDKMPTQPASSSGDGLRRRRRSSGEMTLPSGGRSPSPVPSEASIPPRIPRATEHKHSWPSPPKKRKIPKGFVAVSEKEYWRRMRQAERDGSFMGMGMVGLCCFSFVIMFGSFVTLTYIVGYARDPRYFETLFANFP